MSSPRPRIWIRAALASLPLVAVQVVFTQLQTEFGLQAGYAAHAQAGDQQKQQRETRRTPALRNNVYEKLAKAQAAVEAKNMGEAKEILDDMISAGGKNSLNSYELANVYNLYAFIYYSQENYDGAVKAYEEVLAQPDIPIAMEVNTKYTIAQLYFVQEQWQKGINALLDWFAVTDTPNANAYVLLAQGYYQTKDYDKALTNVKKAINMNLEKGQLPKEQWYNLARFLYFEKGDIPNTVATLEELLRNYPKKQYWVQLSSMYGEQKKDADQVAAMETAYVQNMLDKGPEQVTMAYLYLQAEAPFKAAKVMEKGLKNGSIEGSSRNWELAGAAWRQAQELEKAIPAMEEAASKSDSGELYARLGNIYLDSDQYKQAISAINKGLSKGGVKRPDTARLALGMAYFNNKQYDKAREAFKAAGRDERSAKYAQQWLKYLDTELERQEKLRDG